MSTSYLQELIEAWQDGKLSRRDLMRRAMAAGISAGAVWAALAGRRSVAAQEEAPTPTPIQETHGGEEAAIKIRYWTILSGPDGDEMNELVRKFAEENPDIAVESLQGLTDFEPKIQAAAISGTAPDVALIRHHYIGPFASRNILSPIETSELEEAGIRAEDYDPTVWQFTGYEDQQYTIPLDIHCMALMYNKTRLTEAGLAVPATLDDLRAVAEATTTEDVVGYMHWILNNANSALGFTWLWFAYQHQFGGQMLSEDGTQAALNTPEGIEALTWMTEMEEIGNPQHLPYFDLNRNGQVVTWPDGPWIITAMFNPEQAPASADLESATLPQRDPNAPATWAQSHQFSLPRQGDEDEERRAASLKFVNWITQHSVDWASAGQVPARNSARDEALASEDLYLQKLHPWAEQLSYAKYMPTNVPNMLELLPRLGSHVQEAILGQKSVEDALSDAESEINDILAG